MPWPKYLLRTVCVETLAQVDALSAGTLARHAHHVVDVQVLILTVLDHVVKGVFDLKHPMALAEWRHVPELHGLGKRVFILKVAVFYRAHGPLGQYPVLFCPSFKSTP